MILQKQRTLKTEISYTGIGLHSGREVHATLKPAPEDTGIVFVRTDLPGAPQIHAKAENVTSTLRATTVEEDGHKVFTIEHLMSAFHAHRIDNAYVELDSEEPPVADGASLVFFELMAKAGIAEQAKDERRDDAGGHDVAGLVDQRDARAVRRADYLLVSQVAESAVHTITSQ